MHAQNETFFPSQKTASCQYNKQHEKVALE
jgi:hypothetical protein